MAKASENNKENLYPVEELKEQLSTPNAIYAGVCALNGWKSGREVSEGEYKKAVQLFTGRPIGKAGK